MSAGLHSIPACCQTSAGYTSPHGRRILSRLNVRGGSTGRHALPADAPRPTKPSPPAAEVRTSLSQLGIDNLAANKTPGDPWLGQAGERRAVLHADERVVGQFNRGAVRSSPHLCHRRLGLPESPRAGPQAAGLPALPNAHARHPGVLAAQRRERARIRSERQQRWGRPKPKAAHRAGERSWPAH